jgi:hypothetical protein
MVATPIFQFDLITYSYLIAPIVLQSWGNGSQSCLVEPGLHPWDPTVERKLVAPAEGSETCKPIRDWRYVVFGIAGTECDVP